ncbi:hypothetical protein DH2020_014350 [Rehmannia glutinosa]|uniref:AP180 N-terminal homology (ANTH) domain-containing protein n=1 Tax=Rehmannia glutinosa TaxID=99300 RepID=A0ABR0WWW2_REHGL
MTTGGSQNSLRKTLGALKDTTTVSLAKINSDYKLSLLLYRPPGLELMLRIAYMPLLEDCRRLIIGRIFCFINDSNIQMAFIVAVEYAMDALVALKTLIVIHRALREVDPTFQEEIINYGRSRSHMLNLAHFKDDSSPNVLLVLDPSSLVSMEMAAISLAGWARLQFASLNRNVVFKLLLRCKDSGLDFWLKVTSLAPTKRTKDLDTPELLEHLPALQQLLYRVLGCQVASESIKIYNAISDGTVNLVDKFFEMKKHDALKALDVYRRASLQAERLSEFYEICKTLDVGRGERFIKIEQPPASFLQAMEEYVREAPHASTARKDLADDKPKAILAIEYKKNSEAKKRSGLHEPSPAASELDEKNAMALAIVPVGKFFFELVAPGLGFAPNNSCILID